MKKYLFFVVTLMISVCFLACDDESKGQPTPEPIALKLQKVLPPRSFTTDKLPAGECRLIRTKEELLQFFTADYLSANEQFRSVDFSKSSLIIGLQLTNAGWIDYHASFTKKEGSENHYIYKLLIDLDDTMVVEYCYHGVIVDKVPESVAVGYDISMKVME